MYWCLCVYTSGHVSQTLLDSMVNDLIQLYDINIVIVNIYMTNATNQEKSKVLARLDVTWMLMTI